MEHADHKAAVNGWPVIARYLELRKCRQCELAQVLSLSPAAITQAKQGESLLSPAQLATIVDFLRISEVDLLEFYSSIFNGRIIGRHAPSELEEKRFELQIRPLRSTQLPLRKKYHCCSISELATYEPGLEKLSDFLKRRKESGNCLDQVRLIADRAIEGLVVPGGSVVSIHCDGYPSAGEMVLACLRDRSFRISRYLPGDGVITLEDQWGGSQSLVWRIASDPGFVCWMRPVIELEIKLKTLPGE